MRAIEWVGGEDPGIRIIDQTALPNETRSLLLQTVAELEAAITSLAVRGAPALGAAGGLGVVLAMHQAQRESWDAARLAGEIARVRDARPTAVNLAWGADRVDAVREAGIDTALQEALDIVAEDEAANIQLSELGADWIRERTGKDRVRVVTHCNTGALATAAWGTAYGIIRRLHEDGHIELVYADETRPLLQGSRLTAWELSQDGIPHVIQVDGAASSTILRGLVDVAIIGADRIAADGDTANKVGSVALALAARRAGIPFVVAAPFSTVDLSVDSGDAIEIEQRSAAEVVEFGARSVAPAGTEVFNPAFDVTPHDLISAIVTERGIVEPATGENLFRLDSH